MFKFFYGVLVRLGNQSSQYQLKNGPEVEKAPEQDFKRIPSVSCNKDYDSPMISPMADTFKRLCPPPATKKSQSLIVFRIPQTRADVSAH